ncbi:hypothetical protein Emed_000201 [Eimeria media]
MFRRLRPSSVVILGGGRTPIGSLFGALHAVPASRLAAAAAAAALQRAGAAPQEALAAGQGAAPHRHAMLAAGISPSTDVYRVEKGCASGLKAVSLAASSLGLGQTGLALAVGCDSLSSSPLLLQVLSNSTPAPRYQIPRAACDEFTVLSHKRARDAASEGLLLKEGLIPIPIDPSLSEGSSRRLSRDVSARQKSGDGEGQTDSSRTVGLAFLYALADSPLPSVESHSNTHHLQQQQQQQQQHGKASYLKEDEALRGTLQLDRLASLRPSFADDGVVTAANGFNLGDGAAALLLSTEAEAHKKGLKPLARHAFSSCCFCCCCCRCWCLILSVADAACEPVSFPLAAEEACRRALRLAGLETASTPPTLPVDLFDVVELAAVVPLLLLQRMRLCHTRLNVLGGALSLGHPFAAAAATAAATAAVAAKAPATAPAAAAALQGSRTELLAPAACVAAAVASGMSGVRSVLSLLAALHSRELRFGGRGYSGNHRSPLTDGGPDLARLTRACCSSSHCCCCCCMHGLAAPTAAAAGSAALIEAANAIATLVAALGVAAASVGELLLLQYLEEQLSSSTSTSNNCSSSSSKMLLLPEAAESMESSPARSNSRSKESKSSSNSSSNSSKSDSKSSSNSSSNGREVRKQQEGLQLAQKFEGTTTPPLQQRERK